MTQFNAPTYDLERPSGVCALTGKALTPGDPYIAALVELTAEQMAQQAAAAQGARGGAGAGAAMSKGAMGLGLKRLDISWEAWNQGPRPERLFSHWKSTVPQPHQKRRMFVDDAALVSIFQRLGENDQGERSAFRFVLGLILMRKKLLKYEGTVQRPGPDGAMQEWWKLTPKGEDAQPLEMLDPHMDEAKIEMVREQLSEVLAGEL